MIDSVMYDRIKEMQGAVDVESELYKCAERVSSAPRHLDKPPKPMQLKGGSTYTQFGCCAEFITLYNEKLASAPDSVSVNIMGKDIMCDKEVYVALTALGYSSIHVERERAEAGANIFKLVFMSAKEGAITKDKLYKLVKGFKPSTYYEKEFVKALNVCVFDANEATLYWQSMIDTLGFYDDAVKEGIRWIEENKLDKKTLRTLLEANYSRAKEDKEFMKDIYKPAANKWMIGMLYILHDTHPAVVRPKAVGSDGFM